VETKDLYSLRILEEVDRESTISQRRLASKLEISLGLVNSFMKRLAKKGYFKATTIPPRRVRYLLTPKGLAEKSRLTLEYLDYSLGYYRQIRQGLAQVVSGLAAEGVGRAGLVGTGELAELAYLSLREHGLALAAVAAGPGEQRGHFLGREVVGWDELSAAGCEAVLLALTRGHAEARRALAAAGVEDSRVHDLVPANPSTPASGPARGKADA
jgi:DNA-binding MarR family transcriptional regulator